MATNKGTKGTGKAGNNKNGGKAAARYESTGGKGTSVVGRLSEKQMRKMGIGK